jgi:hypothetical protein
MCIAGQIKPLKYFWRQYKDSQPGLTFSMHPSVSVPRPLACQMLQGAGSYDEEHINTKEVT